MRRTLLMIALVLALLLAGCVQITNPQFDARYRVNAQPIAPTMYAVFALWGSGYAGGAPVQLVVVNLDEHTVDATMPLDGIRTLSDLGSGVPGGGTRLMAASATGFEEIDVAKRSSRVLATLPAASLPGGAAFDSGARVLWSERSWAADFTRIGSSTQTATLDWRAAVTERLGAPKGSPAEVGPLMYAGSAGNRTYFVSESTWLGHDGWGASLWKADFAAGTVSLVSTPTPWPGVLTQLPEMHVERAIARWGVPSADGTRAVAFTSPSDPASRTLLPPSTGAIMFEPGGERYLVTTYPGMGAVEVVEHSLAQPGYARDVLASSVATLPIAPLGVVDDSFAYATFQRAPGGFGGLRFGPEAGRPGDRFALVLRDLKTGASATVLTLKDTAVPSRVDYLGTYTR